MIRALLLSFCIVAFACADLPIQITTVEGSTELGTLIEPAPDLTIAVGDQTLRLDWSEVLEVTPVDRAGKPGSEALPWTFALSDGSQFRGEITGQSETNIEVRIRSNQTVRFEPRLATWFRSAQASDRARAALDKHLADDKRKQAVAIMQRDERLVEITGELLSVSVEKVRFRWKERTLSIPWERLAGLALAPTSVRRTPAVVSLRDGQRFAGQVSGGDDEALLLKSNTLGELVVAWSLVERIQCRSRQVVYLSDVRAISYEHEPLFEKHWPLARDTDFGGQAVSLGGRTFDKALVMHSRARVRFRLGGQFRRFASVVGIIDIMGQRGDAAVAVLGDGRLLWQYESLRGGVEPTHVAVDVSGVQELELLVDYGGDLDLSDHVAWGWPRLLR